MHENRAPLALGKILVMLLARWWGNGGVEGVIAPSPIIDRVSVEARGGTRRGALANSWIRKS